MYNRVLQQINSKIDKEFNEKTLEIMAKECNVLRENYYNYNENKKSFNEWPRVTEQEFEQKLERIKRQKEYNRNKAEHDRKLQEEQNRKARERINNIHNTNYFFRTAAQQAAVRGGSKKNKRNKKHKTLRKKNTRRRRRRQKRH